MRGLMTADFQDETNLTGELLGDVSPVAWSDPPPLKLFLPLPPVVETSFLRGLFPQVVYQSGLFARGRAEVLAFVSCYELWFMTADGGGDGAVLGHGLRAASSPRPERDLLRYRSSCVLFNTLFELQFLEKVSWDCFVPLFRRRRVLRSNKTPDGPQVSLAPAPLPPPFSPLLASAR